MSSSGFEWLVTWTWQASLLTLVVTCALRCVPRLNASARHAIWSATLLVALALAPLSLTPRDTLSGLDVAMSDTGTADPGPGRSATTGNLATSVFPLVVPSPPDWLAVGGAIGWALSTLVAVTQVARDLMLLAQAKRACRPLDPTVERCLTRWRSVSRRGRPVRLCTSHDVAAASMLGLGDPIIAMRPALVDALSRRDLDRVVLHEYAHARRRDDWTGVVHVLVNALVGWHPAVWWIGRHLRLEREVACDEWVVERAGNPHAYASCLSRIAHLSAQLSSRQQNPLLAAGVTTPYAPLLTRVDRLLAPSRRRRRMRHARVLTVLAGVSVGAVSLAALTQVPPLVVVAPSTTTQLTATQLVPNLPRAVAPEDDRPAEGPRPAFSAAETFAMVAPINRNNSAPAHRPEPGRPLDSNSASERIGRASSTDVLSSGSRIASDPIELGQLQPSALVGRGRVSVSARSDVRTKTASTLLTHPLPATRAGLDEIGAPLPVRSRPLGPVYVVEADTPGRRGWIGAAGRAIGSGATHAGLATATAFEHVGTSIVQVFRPGS